MKRTIASVPDPASVDGPSFTHLTTDQITSLGVSRSTIKRKLSSGEWKSYEAAPTGKRRRNRLVLISSLPVDLQLKWARQNFLPKYLAESNPTGAVGGETVKSEAEKRLNMALLRIDPEKRIFWIREALRLSHIVARYGEISPKRERDPETGAYEFVPHVLELCQDAACKDPALLTAEPHRAKPPSPYTLDGWWREYQGTGLLTFLRARNIGKKGKADKRLVEVSHAAAAWMNESWSRFYGPRPFFNNLKKVAEARGWRIPSESWVYRQWQKLPLIVKTFYLEGRKAYESKYAPFVPRDFSDLQPLQVLAGDHSERDVTVSLPNGTLRRPWLTLWYDLLTSLIWGWYLSLAPSSNTSALAYANGVQNFGAQPFSRPEEDFYSYVLTDWGRDYRSHNWDGKEIAVHSEAMRPDGGFELLLVEQKIGILEELDIEHLLTRGKNPKENPVERVHRVISDWEQNTFDEYCGRDAKSRPERWHQLYRQHQQFASGKREASPFTGFEQYREALAQFIVSYNASAHERITLAGERITPIETFRRLYTTRYEISPETLALLLMKAEKRRVRKNGVQCFRKDWSYNNEAMSLFKGADVEVRYSDDDYSKVFVVLPNHSICQAELVTPTSLIKPNKKTLDAVRRTRNFERGVINEFNFIAQSNVRGESVEDRVARRLDSAEVDSSGSVASEVVTPKAAVHKLTRLDKQVIPARQEVNQVTADAIASAEEATAIFNVPARGLVVEVEDD